MQLETRRHFHPVTAPSDAERTVLAYLANTPRETRGLGFSHPARRLSNSAAVHWTETVLLPASMVIWSPFFKNAIGPPFQASGVICPTTRPCVPPENRPSVMRPTFSPSP